MKKAICLLAMVVLLSSGCSTMSKRTKCACTGAAAGAAIGAGAGAIVGHQGNTSNKLGGGLIGATAGAVIGGVTGYIMCKDEPKPVEPAVVATKEVEEKIILSGILFDFDKSVVKPEFYPILDEAVATIKKNPTKQIIIEGHTCSVGSESYNLKLSERRAESVKKYLVIKGISEASLSAKGYGESSPIADNKTKDGRKMNRRVEFKVTFNKGN